ncbi:MAG: ISAs1 family transposase [Planctomycetaceae bacterium]
MHSATLPPLRDALHGLDRSRDFPRLPAIRAVAAVRRTRFVALRTIGIVVLLCQRDGNETSDMRYIISSLAMGVQRFARAARGHLGIENSCHWSLDVADREDDSRMRDERLRENMAGLNRFTLSLLKQHPSKDSLVMKRRACGWSDDSLTEVRTGKASYCAPALATPTPPAQLCAAGCLPCKPPELFRCCAVGFLQTPLTENGMSSPPIEILCADFLLLDCREQDEYDRVRMESCLLLPMSEIAQRVGELDGRQRDDIIVYCHHGGRSLRVATWLREQGFHNARSMTGGIDHWAIEIDPSLLRY